MRFQALLQEKSLCGEVAAEPGASTSHAPSGRSGVMLGVSRGVSRSGSRCGWPPGTNRSFDLDGHADA